MKALRYSRTGHLAYLDDANALFVVPFDVGSLQTSGPATVVAEDVLYTATGGGQFDLSARGVLAYVPSGNAPALAWLDSTGEVTKSSAGVAAHPRFSPDGNRVAVDLRSGESTDIWIFDARGTQSRLTVDGRSDYPAWSPDGSYVAFATGGSISLKRADGTGESATVWASDTYVRPTSWSRDSRFLALESQQDSRDVWILPLESRGGGQNIRAADEPLRLHATDFEEGGAVFSPNGRWLAFVTTETGRAEVYVESFPDLDEKLIVSTGGGTEPVWSSDGATLYFRKDDNILEVRVRTEPTLSADTPQPVFQMPQVSSSTHAHYDVARDGQQFVARWRSASQTPRRIHVITNWLEELTRLAPGQ